MALAQFDELNMLEDRITEFSESVGTATEAESRTLSASAVEDDLEDLLIMAYTMGVDYANDVLGTDIKADMQEMEDTVYRKIDGKDFRDRVREHMADGQYGLVGNTARTDAQMAYNQAVLNTAQASGKSGIRKKWFTMGDNLVRDAHWALQGVTLPINDEFYIDDDHALAPCGFAKPENSCNCRCFLQLLT